MTNLVFLIFGLGLLLLGDKILVTKFHKTESQMDEFDFTMRPPQWMRSIGLVWIAVGIFVMVIAFRDSLILFGFILLGFTALGMRPLRMKIVVRDSLIIVHKFFSVNRFTFNEISEVMMDQYDYADVIFSGISEELKYQFTDVICYNVHGKKKMKFAYDWSGFLLMIQRLFDIGILPWIETNRNKKDRQNLIVLMDFFIEHDLTTWYSFNKREAIQVGFKLYKYDLTDEGQYLFTSNAVLKWIDFVYNGGNIYDFSLLDKGLLEYGELAEKEKEQKTAS